MLSSKLLTSQQHRPQPLKTLAQRVQGTVSPLVGIGACVSIQFGALEYTKRTFAQMNIRAGRGGVDGKELSGAQLVTAGSIAGIANSVVSGPVEHIRIRASYLIPAFISSARELISDLFFQVSRSKQPTIRSTPDP